MSTVGTLKLNPFTKQWELKHGFRVIHTGPTKATVKTALRLGEIPSAVAVGMSTCTDEDYTPTSLSMVPRTAPEMTVEEHFDWLGRHVKAVLDPKRGVNALVVLGTAGIGKTTTIREAIDECGYLSVAALAVLTAQRAALAREDKRTAAQVGVLETMLEEKPKTFFWMAGSASPKWIYRQLYNNRSGLVVFDDCDSAFKKDEALSVINAAIDDKVERWVTWGTESDKDEDLPKQFLFTGKVIIISNANAVPSPLWSRALTKMIRLDRPQIVQRMRYIACTPGFYPQHSLQLKLDCLAFIEENMLDPSVRVFDLRTLGHVIDIRQEETNRDDWQVGALDQMRTRVR